MDKVLQLLSLAKRANKIASGEYMTEESVKGGMAYLVILAEDASDNTKKKFTNMCTYRDVPMLIYSNKEELGHHIGTEFRASLAVLDKGFADKIISLCKQ